MVLWKLTDPNQLPKTVPPLPEQPLLTLEQSSRGTALMYSPDGRVLLTEHGIWEARTGAPLHAFADPASKARPLRATFSPDGHRAALGGDKAVELWTIPDWLASKPALLKSASFADPIDSLAFSPDGRRLAVAFINAIQFWDMETWSLLRTLAGHEDHCCSRVVFSPEGWVVSGGVDKLIRVWDPTTGQLIRTLSGHNGAIRVLAFLPDRRLMSGDWDGIVKLWNIDTGQVLGSFGYNGEHVWSLVASPDGRWIASGGEAGAIRFWRATSADLASTIVAYQKTGHFDPSVDALAFSPDSRTLASASHEGPVRIWPTPGASPYEFDQKEMPAKAGSAASPR
jgi:WD40 repeat protein